MAGATLEQLRVLGIDSFAVQSTIDPDKRAALDATLAMMQGIMSPAYPPPWTEPLPLDVIKCQCVLASWDILLSKGYNPEPGKDDHIVAMVQWWRDWLEKIAESEISTPITGPNIPTPGADSGGAGGPSVITATQRGYSERGIDPGNPPRVYKNPFSGN